MTLHLVIGPPCGGKTTWVRDHAKPGDIVIDYDRLANALTAEGDPQHGLKRPVATVAYQAREAAIREALRHGRDHEVFIIHTLPKPHLMARYKAAGAEVVTCDPGRAVAEERCRRLRPESSMDGLRRWYAGRSRAAPPQDTTTQQPPGEGATRPAKGSRAW